MATYNGEKYVVEQLQSILEELTSEDEVVIYDDASSDNTLATIASIRDPRIRVIASKTNGGHVRAFENAILNARGHYIFLSDQDDIWKAGRRALLLEALKTRHFVASNWEPFGQREKPGVRLEAKTSNRPIRNIAGIFRGSMPYFGCAMAMDREALALVLPFPSCVEAHDLWLGIVGNLDGGFVHLPDVTVARRIHLNNLTPVRRRRLRLVARSRVILTRLLIIGVARYVSRGTLRGLARNSPDPDLY